MFFQVYSFKQKTAYEMRISDWSSDVCASDLLTARGEDTERIVGLEIGADDYVVKPFNPRALVARIRTVLRRTQRGGRTLDGGGTCYAFGDWVLREVERVLVDGEGNEVALSSGEYHLLQALVRHPRQVMSRYLLLDLVLGLEADIFHS